MTSVEAMESDILVRYFVTHSEWKVYSSKAAVWVKVEIERVQVILCLQIGFIRYLVDGGFRLNLLSHKNGNISIES